MWSIKNWVFFWLVSWIWSAICFLIITIIITFLNNVFAWNLLLIDMAIVVQILHQIILWISISILLTIILRKMETTFKAIWGTHYWKINDVLLGIFMGFTMLLTYYVISKTIIGHIRISPEIINAKLRIFLVIDLMLSASLVVIIEEIGFRGIIYRLLRNKYSNLYSIFLSSCIFTCFHLDHLLVNYLLLFYVFIFGLVSAWLLHRTCSLTASVICHFISNTVFYIIEYSAYFQLQ